LEGKNALQKGDTAKAIQAFHLANRVDSLYAECYFQLAEIDYAQGNFATAKSYYTKAKELDNLRFRAPKVFNEIIRNVPLTAKGFI